MSTHLDARRIQFARELADPDWSLSVPEPAKAVIRDLLDEVDRLAAAPGKARTATTEGAVEAAARALYERRAVNTLAAGGSWATETDETWKDSLRADAQALADEGLLTTTHAESADHPTAATEHRCGSWRLDDRGACVHCGEKPPIIQRADSFKGGDPLNDLAILLMRTWGLVDPSSDVAQHPGGYIATFADMARAVLTDSTAATADLIETAARTLALADDYDGCFERLDAWAAATEEQRESGEVEEPMSTDVEDAEFWRRRARALEARGLLASAGPGKATEGGTHRAVTGEPAQAAVDRMAAAIHEAWEFQYGECDHGTYSGGGLHGVPYEMCRVSAQRILRRQEGAAQAHDV